MMDAIRTSEASAHFNVTTRRYISEDSELYTRRRVNTKSQNEFIFLMEADVSRPYSQKPVIIAYLKPYVSSVRIQTIFFLRSV
jgi:hypothetical protein